MALSKRFAGLVRTATAGLTDAEVLELTGLGFATYRRMLQGIIPSDATIAQFCAGLSLDATPFLEAAAEARPKTDPIRLLTHALVLAGLSPNARLKVVELVNDLMERERHAKAAA